jgi:16S rRNA (guanine1207-N2)-methyltransferase
VSRSAASVDRRSGAALEAWAKDSLLCLPAGEPSLLPLLRPHLPLPPLPPRPWRTYPGLFARGGLDVMTAALLASLPLPPARSGRRGRKRARLLDFACGSGAVGASLQQRAPGACVHLLDADAVALDAARRNVPAGEGQRVVHHLSDGFAHLDREGGGWGGHGGGNHGGGGEADGRDGGAPGPKRAKASRPAEQAPLRFDWIVSNPPVHRGLTDDFEVVRGLAAGAPARLRPGGCLWVVAQSYVPVGALLEAVPAFDTVALHFSDGRFVVWRASVP